MDSSGLLGNTSIVGSTDGQRLTAVWNQANPSNLSVRVRQSADGGATWAPAQFISSASNSIPRVAASADGTKATVVWTEQTMTNTLALVSSWNSTTNTWSGPTIVGPNNDEATYPEHHLLGRRSGRHHHLAGLHQPPALSNIDERRS